MALQKPEIVQAGILEDRIGYVQKRFKPPLIAVVGAKTPTGKYSCEVQAMFDGDGVKAREDIAEYCLSELQRQKKMRLLPMKKHLMHWKHGMQEIIQRCISRAKML